MSDTHDQTITHPSQPPRRILLVVTGLSPQVVTESLFALAVRAADPWVPTEVQLITTAEGAERARLALLSDHPGWFRRLLSDYQLPEIQFDRRCIHVLTDGRGQPLEDIRTADDSRRAADQICALVRQLSADPQSALHLSIAGGRKTMGDYLGYALSLFGRPQDRLSHVLVSEPFESSWDFFYPSPESRVMTTRDNKLVDAREAQVTLAEIPFLRVREGLPPRLLDGAAGFVETVDTAQRALAPPELCIDLNAQSIHAAGETLRLPPAQLAFYLMLAERRLEGLDGLRWDDDDIADQYLAAYRRLVGELSGNLERVQSALAGGMTEEYFEERKAKTNSAIKTALGPQLAAPYLIHSQGERPQTRSALALAPEAIRVVRAR